MRGHAKVGGHAAGREAITDDLFTLQDVEQLKDNGVAAVRIRQQFTDHQVVDIDDQPVLEADLGRLGGLCHHILDRHGSESPAVGQV